MPDALKTILPLGPADVAAMLDLFREALPPHHLERSIYVASGVQAYLELIARSRPLLWHEQLWGVKDGAGRLVAAAHSRSQCQGSHLNNFAVLPTLQAKGLGSLMMRHWEAMARSEGAVRLTLDVAEDSPRARGLYVRFAFREVATTHEFVVQPPPVPRRPASLRLLGWPQALATLEAYGFGRFQVEVDCKDHFVDLLPGVFRCSNPDQDFLAALAWIDPDRKVLVRTPNRAQPDTWEWTGALLRMQKDLSQADAAPERVRTPTDALP